MFPMGKRSFKSEEEEEGEEVKEEEEKESEMEERVNGNGKKIVIRVVFGQRLRTPMVGGSSSLCCQADECGVDLRMAKKYHQRHKVCERHSKAAVVLVSGIRQRFCQQCSKFHELQQFDDTKRSCRERLAGHNERRRKTNAELHPRTEQTPESSQMNGSSLKAFPNFSVTNI